jgi:hypothetical protein
MLMLILQIQCFPLYSLLLALGNPTVNLFILDVEGAEYMVLKTIPWHKVDIEVSLNLPEVSLNLPFFVRVLKCSLVQKQNKTKKRDDQKNDMSNSESKNEITGLQQVRRIGKKCRTLTKVETDPLDT